jgi:hypothetical protein
VARYLGFEVAQTGPKHPFIQIDLGDSDRSAFFRLRKRPSVVPEDRGIIPLLSTGVCVLLTTSTWFSQARAAPNIGLQTVAGSNRRASRGQVWKIKFLRSSQGFE